MCPRKRQKKSRPPLKSDRGIGFNRQAGTILVGTSLAKNQTVLEGKVASRDTLRSTPGGVATLYLALIHQSTQREANADVAVEIEINAVAFGELATEMNSVNEGDNISIKGFLSRKNRFSPMPILHITQFKFSLR